MGKKQLFLVLLTILSLFILSAGTVSAQDLNLDDMDRDQLLLLIQMIQNKLADTDQAAENTPEPDGPVIPTATPTPELKTFSIYENKKLMIEALPGYMFVPKENGNSDEDEGPSITTTPVPKCDPGCEWFCPPQPSVLACGCRCG